MNSFYHLLPKIRKRPALYLRNVSLESLDTFWFGYNLGTTVKVWENETGLDYFENYEKASQSEISQGEYFMDGFLEFVADHYDVASIGGMGWQTIIQRNSDSDEEAFYKFFELFDEFLEQKGIAFPDTQTN